MTQKKKSLPKNWAYVEVRNMKIASYENDKPILVDIGLKKTITLPKEKLDVLNSQTENTRLSYKIVDHAPEDAPTAEQIAEAEAKELAILKAKEREELKAEIKAELEAEAKK